MDVLEFQCWLDTIQQDLLSVGKALGCDELETLQAVIKEGLRAHTDRVAYLQDHDLI